MSEFILDGYIKICKGTLKLMVVKKVSRHKNRGTRAPGVNPQGYGQDAEFSEEPKSKLENAAKKTNKK